MERDKIYVSKVFSHDGRQYKLVGYQSNGKVTVEEPTHGNRIFSDQSPDIFVEYVEPVEFKRWAVVYRTDIDNKIMLDETLYDSEEEARRDHLTFYGEWPIIAVVPVDIKVGG